MNKQARPRRATRLVSVYLKSIRKTQTNRLGFTRSAGHTFQCQVIPDARHQSKCKRALTTRCANPCSHSSFTYREFRYRRHCTNRRRDGTLLIGNFLDSAHLTHIGRIRINYTCTHVLHTVATHVHGCARRSLQRPTEGAVLNRQVGQRGV